MPASPSTLGGYNDAWSNACLCEGADIDVTYSESAWFAVLLLPLPLLLYNEGEWLRR
jgi:hypothetical protein